MQESCAAGGLVILQPHLGLRQSLTFGAADEVGLVSDLIIRYSRRKENDQVKDLTYYRR
jgi:hypothetical protein